MRIKKIQELIEERSPLDLQEPWDNSGFQIELKDIEINRVLVAMEITSSVIEEAIDQRADLIITHHPLIFSPFKIIDHDSATGSYIIKLIQNGISVYSTHTPFDKCEGGNNDYMAKLLNLCRIRIMEADESGFCRVGYVDGECTVGEYIEQVSRWLKIKKDFMNFSGCLEDEVSKVGLCTGAGAEFIEAAAKEGCHLFITGDVKYHTARKARELGLNILDIGHYGSEKNFTENMASYLRSKTTLEIIESGKDLNPFVKL